MALLAKLGRAQVVCAIVAVRLLSVAVVQTWYVPDEYWQSLEVAHRLAFGYGALTWEWERGVRSHLYPAVFAALYALLRLTGLDYPAVVVIAPRILQALVSAVGDYSLYVWSGHRKWALYLSLTSWFWFYIGSRTLLQTVEVTLVALGLSLFPFNEAGYPRQGESSAWVWVAAVNTFVRPSSGAVWAVLAARHLVSTKQPRLRLLVRTYLPIAAVVTAALGWLDSWLLGRWTLTPWEFVRFNVLNGLSSFYGTHPWHWYLSVGLWAVLGATAPPVLWGLYCALRGRRSATATVLLAAVAAHLAVHSAIPHKEFRFLAPILPILLYLAQDAVVVWSRKANKWQLYLVALWLAAGGAAPALYFGRLHQAGTTAVMPLLRASISNSSSVAFLMPCHSTPLYSHLHVNVSTRYMNCSPPAEGAPPAASEADTFFNNPQRWWRAEYGPGAPHQAPGAPRQAPSHVVLFDVARGRLQRLLDDHRYSLLYSVPHTQFPEGEVGANVLVYARAPPSPADAAPPAPPAPPVDAA